MAGWPFATGKSGIVPGSVYFHGFASVETERQLLIYEISKVRNGGANGAGLLSKKHKRKERKEGKRKGREVERPDWLRGVERR